MMHWFKKETPKDPWDEELAGPLSDLAAAKKIRAICKAASAGAQQLNGSGYKGGNQGRKQDAERYARAARKAMELAMSIANDPLRDIAVRQIIGLCMILQNFQTAQILVRAIRSEAIKGEVLKEHPGLRQ